LPGKAGESGSPSADAEWNGLQSEAQPIERPSVGRAATAVCRCASPLAPHRHEFRCRRAGTSRIAPARKRPPQSAPGKSPSKGFPPQSWWCIEGIDQPNKPRAGKGLVAFLTDTLSAGIKLARPQTRGVSFTPAVTGVIKPAIGLWLPVWHGPKSRR